LIAQAAAEKNVRLIFSNSASVFSGSLAAKRLNVPHVWSIHEILAGDQPILFYILGRKNLVRLISRSSCCVIVNSEASRRPFEEYPNVRVVYNGIPFKDKGPRDRTEAKKALGLSHDDLILGIIGKIYAGKGQKEVILAVERLRRSLPSVKLFITGAVKDRRYNRELERLIHQYSLQDRIFFTGQVPDVFKYLKAMDLLIVASRVESFGRTAVEAMAAGTPVLALKAGGLPEIISHKQNGYLMDSADPDTIQSAVESVFKDPSLTSEIIKNGLQTYKERFSLEKHVRQVEDILDMCLRGKRDHA
jgi:glycosyltransferase involved in cell wall biosynthesis